MHPPESNAELEALMALVEAVRRQLWIERNRFQQHGEVTPLLRSCLDRARGHLELAQQSLDQAHTGSASHGHGAAAGLEAPLQLEPWHRTPQIQPGAPGQAAPAGDGAAVTPNGVQEAGDDAPSNWVRGRLDEIGQALEMALGGGFEEDPAPIASDSNGGSLGDNVTGASCPAPSAEPQFMGRTDVLSVPDLIGFFQQQNKTGRLEIEHDNETFSLEFTGGALIHAGSSNSPEGERLGEILVRRGALTEARLDRYLAHLASGKKIGTALQHEEIVAPEELAAALRDQVLGIFVRLAKLPGCQFTFREGGIDPDIEGQVRYNVTGLLLESARQMDEANAPKRESA